MSLKRFIANQPVLSIAAVLAVISMFFVKPSKAYISYIDFRTLALLFCLMLVVAGWQKAGLFRGIASYLLGKISDTRQLVMILVFLCFFSSMLITNDVALSPSCHLRC